MKRKRSWLAARLHALEGRLLCAASVVGPLSAQSEAVGGGARQVVELGAVSYSQIDHGVEVTANVPASGSVTFRMSIDFHSDFVLRFAHTGGDVLLHLSGPIGEATVVPGPAGEFQSIPLSLKAGHYDITAIGITDSPAFVDWELLLANGIGQATTQSPTIAAPLSVSIPFNPGSPATSNANPTSSTSSLSTSYLISGAPSSPAGLVATSTGDLIGRPTIEFEHIAAVSPVVDEGVLALALNSDQLPVGLEKAKQTLAAEEGVIVIDRSQLAKFELSAETIAGDQAAVDSAAWAHRVVEGLTSWLPASQLAATPPEAVADVEKSQAAVLAATPVETPSETPSDRRLTTARAAWLIPFAAFAIRYRSDLSKPFHKFRSSKRTSLRFNKASDSTTPHTPALPRWRRNSMILQGPTNESQNPFWRPRSMKGRTTP